jgi:hypothetical protein
MDTDTQAGQGQHESVDSVATTDDWWSTGRSVHSNTRVSAPPIVVYPSRDYDRSRVGPALTVASGGAVMLMSALPWVTSNHLHHYTKIAGTTPFITKAISSNGWLTLTGGATLLFMGALMLASSVYALRIVTALLAFITAGIASYDMVRMADRIHDARHSASALLSTHLPGAIHLGYGLMVILGVSFLAAIVSLFELATRD